MKEDLEDAMAKLMNPRMRVGLKVIHALLEPLQGPPVAPSEVREVIDDVVERRKVSKQSITNAARRLEEANIIAREEGYQINYGVMISILLNKILELTNDVRELEEEIDKIKSGETPIG